MDKAATLRRPANSPTSMINENHSTDNGEWVVFAFDCCDRVQSTQPFQVRQRTEDLCKLREWKIKSLSGPREHRGFRVRKAIPYRRPDEMGSRKTKQQHARHLDCHDLLGHCLGSDQGQHGNGKA